MLGAYSSSSKRYAELNHVYRMQYAFARVKDPNVSCSLSKLRRVAESSCRASCSSSFRSTGAAMVYHRPARVSSTATRPPSPTSCAVHTSLSAHATRCVLTPAAHSRRSSQRFRPTCPLH